MKCHFLDPFETCLFLISRAAETNLKQLCFFLFLCSMFFKCWTAFFQDPSTKASYLLRVLGNLYYFFPTIFKVNIVQIILLLFWTGFGMIRTWHEREEYQKRIVMLLVLTYAKGPSMPVGKRRTRRKYLVHFFSNNKQNLLFKIYI